MRARRILLGLALFFAILATAFLLRLPIAGYAVRTALAGAGLKEAQLHVTALSFSGARVENLSAGPQGDKTIRFDFIEADFDWLSLLKRREIDALRLGPGAVRISVSQDGKVSLPGISMAGGNGGGGAPFNTLALSDVALRIDTPEGAATGKVTADFDVQKGGRATVSMSTPKAGYTGIVFENSSVSAEIILDRDGGAQLDGSFIGNVSTDAVAVRDANVSVSANKLLWRAAGAGKRPIVTGDVLVNVDNADIPVDHVPALAGIKAPQVAAMIGDPVASLSISGALMVKSLENGFAIDTASADDPAIIRSDTGLALMITGLGEAPLYRRGNEGGRAAFNFDLSGAAIDARGAIEAENIGSTLMVAAPLHFGAYQSDRLSFDSAAVTINATAKSTEIEADISVASYLRSGKIGRLNIFDAPLEMSFGVAVDNVAGRAVVTPAKECLALDNIRATIDRQDTEILLSGAKFCANGEPVAVIDWNDVLQTTITGRLSASHARYRLGNTRLIGRPPQIESTAVYTPSLNQTLINGKVDGGRMALNDLLTLASTSGQFTLSLDKETMRAELNANQTRVSQQREPPLVGPVLASVDLSLLNKSATFDYVLTTLSGARIGAGAGNHDVATSSGQSRLVLDEIEFTPEGLQPAAILPVMKGFVREASGTATGIADFSWVRSGGIASSADIQIIDMTFSGPSRIVNKTKGLNGTIQFEDLWPLTTAGAQSITVEGADLDALQLQSGEITFEMRGDEKLRVERAVFPWFGGALGVDSATMALSGGEAVAPLRADRVDLKQILEFADIDGLSGEGVLSGVLPLVVRDGRAHIENGVLNSDGAGAIRYRGNVGDAAASAGGQAQMAFDLLRDLRFETFAVRINGPLDGRLQFQIDLQGTGEIDFAEKDVRVPVNYHINLDAALLELLNQAALTRKIESQIEMGSRSED